MPNEPLTLALRWLSQRSLSAYEVSQRLAQRQVAKDDIDAVLALLIERGYVNDERLAEQIVAKSLAHRDGPAKVEARLAQRGIPAEVRRRVAGQALAQVDWLKIAEGLIPRYDMSNPKGRARLVRHLAREGFPPRVIYQVAGEKGKDSSGLDSG